MKIWTPRFFHLESELLGKHIEEVHAYFGSNLAQISFSVYILHEIGWLLLLLVPLTFLNLQAVLLQSFLDQRNQPEKNFTDGLWSRQAVVVQVENVAAEIGFL